MRLIKYINEEQQLQFDFFNQFEKNDPITKSIKLFEKDTKPWFKYCKKQRVKNKFLWRGSSNVVKNFMRKKVHNFRDSTDTCSEVHNLSDEYFDKLFGIKARSNTLFCFSNKISAKNYGYPNIVIPAGKFNFIWSKKVDDFFSYLEGEDFYEIICDSEVDEDSFEESYEYNYGKESENGTWYYENKDTGESNLDIAIDIIFEEMEDNGEIEIDPDDEEGEIEEIKWQIENELEWVPEKDFHTFIMEKVDNAENELYEFIKNNYVKNKYFKELMDNKTFRTFEVMLDCKEYYLINEDWASKYLKEV
jgi:hypothetical protein